MAEHSQQLLFQDCFISFVESKELSHNEVAELTTLIESHGATIVEPKADGRIKLSEVTHIISMTSDFPDYFKAVDHCIPVVNRGWIAASLTKNKLVGLRPFTPDPKLFFSGVSVHCADIPDNDKDAIIGAVMALGGQDSKVLGKTTTHLVALSMDHEACKTAVAKRLRCKIVLPHWFDDCLKLGKRIDEGPYTLPNPDILRSGPTDPLPVPATPEMIGATSARPDYLPKPADSPSARRLHVFDKKKVMLSADLQLNDRLRRVLEGLVEKGGGAVTNDVEKCDMFVCQYRDGDDYIMASRTKKDVGNLSWLFYLLTYNKWTSPMRRLLHYPVPRDGIPGFEATKMSISNYGGEARIYLENLIKACGGEATKAFRMDNTHLITARNHSEKCEAAQEWNLPMINHLWLEESYAKCKIQSLTNPRYMHFPARTNLGEVVGQTMFEPHILEQYFETAPESQTTSGSPSVTRGAVKSKDANATRSAAAVEAEEDAETKGEAEPEVSSAMEVDMPDAPELVAKPAKKARKPSTTPVPDCKSTPAVRRLREASKENESPSSRSTPSRASKDRANTVLHELSADIADYEKERKRKSVGGLWGGKRAADALDKERGKKRESSMMTAGTTEDEADEEEEDTKPAKKAKTVKGEVKPKTQMQMKLLITGYKKWQGDIGKEDKDKKKLKELGIQVITDPNACNFLAAPAMVRTQKFLCALANGVTILNSEFIDTCVTSSTVPETKDFILVDKPAEKRFGVVLADAVTRAKANKRGLLKGVAVYCTEGIPNGMDTYRSIVESNGGEFAVYRGRKGVLKKREEGDVEEVYLITGVSKKETALWSGFEKMAKEAGHKPRVVLTDWLLDTAMAQEIKWKDMYLAANF